VPIALALAGFIFLAQVAKSAHTPTRNQLLAPYMLALVMGAAMAALWWVLLACFNPLALNVVWADWWRWQTAQIHLIPNFSSTLYAAKNLPWFTWPLWPFAIWAAYTWRKQWRAPHIALPLLIVVALLLLALWHPHTGASELMPLLPALAVLAAFGLSTIKRAAKSAVDWFSLFASTFVIGALWLLWVAKMTGWPPQLARNVFKLAEGLKPEFNFFLFALALTATLIWLGLLVWRVGRHRGALWRPVVLSASGIVLVWVLLMTLWLPSLNYARSYAETARALKTKLPANTSCIATAQLGAAQRASFAFYGGLKFGSGTECQFLLMQDNPSPKTALAAPLHAKLLWEGRRPSDKDERFRLFLLSPSASPSSLLDPPSAP
jgi:4-amino-4-deoxy-L-arabinose transferase-like glycosyltransferase